MFFVEQKKKNEKKCWLKNNNINIYAFYAAINSFYDIEHLLAWNLDNFPLILCSSNNIVMATLSIASNIDLGKDLFHKEKENFIKNY